MQESLTGDLVRLNSVLDDLEELGDIMGEMLHNQDEVEVRSSVIRNAPVTKHI